MQRVRLMLFIIVLICALIIALLFGFAIYKFGRYLYYIYLNKNSKLQDHSKIHENVNLDPIFETNHQMDLKLEDPVINNSILVDDKKLNDLENIGSAYTPGSTEKEPNSSSENSIEFKDLGDQLVKSETELQS